MAQLKQYYKDKVVPELAKQFGLSNTMRVPKITKVVLNMGLGEAVADKKILDNATSDLESISGQKVVITKARKTVSQRTKQGGSKVSSQHLYDRD